MNISSKIENMGEEPTNEELQKIASVLHRHTCFKCGNIFECLEEGCDAVGDEAICEACA